MKIGDRVKIIGPNGDPESIEWRILDKHCDAWKRYNTLKGKLGTIYKIEHGQDMYVKIDNVEFDEIFYEDEIELLQSNKWKGKKR